MSALQNGFQFGQQIKQKRDQQNINQLAAQSYGAPEEQRPQLLGQMAGIDARAAREQEKAFEQGDERRNRSMVNMAKLLMNAPEQSRPGLWRTFVPALAKFGVSELPQDYTPETAPIINQAADSIVKAYSGGDGANNVQSRFVGEDGMVYTVLRDGQTVNTGIKADRQAWFRDQPGIAPGIVGKDGSVTPIGGSAPVPVQAPTGDNPMQVGQGAGAVRFGMDGMDPVRQQRLAQTVSMMQQAGYEEGEIEGWLQSQLAQPQAVEAPMAQNNGLTATRPAVSPAEQQRLALAEAANQRAAEASQRAAEAAQRAERGNAPAGFRFKQDGNLEPIPGGPKPAGAVASEDERKAAAWLAQSRNAYKNMVDVIEADPGASEPGLIETYVPIDEIANRSRSDTRQQYVQAASSLSEALLRAATGAGVNRDEAIQKVRELTPQRGDSAAVRQQKMDAIPVYLEALEARAGRAAPGMQAGQGGSSPQAARPTTQADFDALPSGATYIDPDDGRTYRKP